MKKVLLSVSALLFLLCCSDEEREDEKCWTCIMYEIFRDKDGNILSDSVREWNTVETCKKSEKERLENYHGDGERLYADDDGYAWIGSIYTYYSCYEK